MSLEDKSIWALFGLYLKAKEIHGEAKDIVEKLEALIAKLDKKTLENLSQVLKKHTRKDYKERLDEIKEETVLAAKLLAELQQLMYIILEKGTL